MINKFSIAFYNVENFFDTYDDPHTADDAFTPKGFMHWIKKRYFNKANKIAYVISEIGRKHTGISPVLVGLGEVENKTVLNDLLKSKYLKNLPYDFVHFDSQDRRGIDVALLYRTDFIKVLESAVFPLTLYTDEGKPYQSRDILYVKVLLNDKPVHIIINHWPSRREGDFESDFKRLQAARLLQDIIDQISYEEDESNFIIMGDFNTDPTDKHLIDVLNKNNLFNPTSQLLDKTNGTISHQNRWHLFDQFLLSENFRNNNTLRFKSAHIYQPKSLKVWKGKHKNLPFRTFLGPKYQGGYSDHFPVYLLFKN